MMRFVRWGGLAVTAGLLAMMLGPFQGAEREFGLSDKAAHALAFAAITGAFFLNWRSGSRIQIAGLAMVIAIGVELVQAMTGRDAEISDLAADAIGIAVIALAWRRRVD